VIPALPAFTARYPQIELDIGLNDRPVDLIREGVDCVLRGGPALDESLVARPLAMMDQLTLASPGYLERMGIPAGLDDLANHQMVEYVSTASGKRFGLEFLVDNAVHSIQLPKRVAVNSSDGYFAACEAGYGLIQAPHYHAMRQLAEGRLVPVLAQLPVPTMALTALYPPHRQLSQRVRVFVDWLVELCRQPGTGLHR
jgi:DNA-binding transcriptional LysR family regulator